MILVVDDEKAVREMAAGMLRRSGFAVFEAPGSAAALQVLESHTDVTVLLTDCNMPDVSGAELARQVVQRWPHIGIIAISGQPRAAEMPPEADFIAKPFRAAALVALVQAHSTAGSFPAVGDAALPC